MKHVTHCARLSSPTATGPHGLLETKNTFKHTRQIHLLPITYSADVSVCVCVSVGDCVCDRKGFSQLLSCPIVPQNEEAGVPGFKCQNPQAAAGRSSEEFTDLQVTGNKQQSPGPSVRSQHFTGLTKKSQTCQQFRMKIT